MSTRTNTISSIAAAITLSAFLVAPFPAAQAQSAQPDGRWQAWMGCWEPAVDAPEGSLAGKAQVPLTCVIPADSGTAVDFVNVLDGRITQRKRVVASGERLPSTRDGCTGWESAEWAASGTRVYLKSAFTCQGNLERRSSGVIDISPSGEWLDVEGVAAGAGQGVRVTRYREAPGSATLPPEVVAALAGQQMSSSAARIAAMAPLTLAEIGYAAKQLDAPVVEAWLVERDEGFKLDATGLRQLADAGVPPSVIDVMVALSNPDVFAIRRMSEQGELSVGRNVDEPDKAGGYGRVVMAGWWDPFFGSPYGYGYYSPYGYGYYSPYGFSRYGSLYGPFGYNYYYPGRRPVVVVVRGSGDGNVSPQGRAVRGRGYTQGGGGSVSRPSSTSGSSGGRAATSRGSSGGKSGSTRGAHRKP